MKILLLFFLFGEMVFASFAFYIGKNVTTEKRAFIGGSGEEVSGHWLEIRPRQSYKPGARVTVGVTAKAGIPGEQFEIPQVKETFRYMGTFYTQYKGNPPPLINGGMNEYGVTIRDVWAPSHQRLVEMTPRPQKGLNYSDLSRLMLERAKSAREAVEILGRLIKKHGHATYGGNSHLVADANEGWLVIEYAGGQGLWVAKRLKDNDVEILYPGQIERLPLNYKKSKDYQGSDNLISFAESQKWFSKKGKTAFPIHQIYGSQKFSYGQKYPRKLIGIQELKQEILRKEKISFTDFLNILRDPRYSDDEAGYAHAAILTPNQHPLAHDLWVSPIGAISAPFVPLFVFGGNLPPTWAKHRYLLKESSHKFLSPRFARQEGSDFLFHLYKRVLYLTCSGDKRYYDENRKIFQSFENASYAQIKNVKKMIHLFARSKKRMLARELATKSNQSLSQEVTKLGKDLISSLLMRQRYLEKPMEVSGEINVPMTADRKTITCLKN